MPEVDAEERENKKRKTLMESLMPDFDEFFEVDEKQAKYAWDSLHAA